MPDANVGIHCAGLVAVDIDTRSGGDVSLQTLDDLHGVPPTLTTRTPTGGRHLFYRLPPGREVGNSAGKLGPGLDIKTNGGYVVAPGSDVDTGRYHFENAQTPIAEAPEWLLDLLGPPGARQRDATPASAIPPAPDQTLAQTRSWLAGQPSGEGAFATACGLRDRGASLEQALALMAEHDPRPNVPEKVEHAYRYASGKPGAKAVVDADLPVQTVGTSAQVPTVSHKVLRLDELAERTSPSDYLVKGVLQKGAYVVMYGDRGEGKTFVALDVAYHVARGTAWMDRLVKQGPVLYLAFEGAGGLAKRARALRQHYGTDQVPFYVDTAGYNLRDLTGRAALGATVHALPEMPVLIVIDTFAHALRGGDENSAQDVGAFNTAVVELIKHTGATVLVIHHSGKNKNAGPRGSSALGAAIDAELEIDGGKITATKQRDIELGDPIGFKLHPMVVGADSDGDEITSCVVLPSATPVDELPALKGNAKNAISVLCDLAPDNAPVSTEAWMAGCAEFYGERDLRRKFFEVKRALLDKGYVSQDNDGMVKRRLE